MGMAMTNEPAGSDEQLRKGLLEVLSACPTEACNPTDCPLYQLRQMEYERRLQWLNALSRSDLEYLAAYHYVCMKLKAGDRHAHP